MLSDLRVFPHPAKTVACPNMEVLFMRAVLTFYHGEGGEFSAEQLYCMLLQRAVSLLLKEFADVSPWAAKPAMIFPDGVLFSTNPFEKRKEETSQLYVHYAWEEARRVVLERWEKEMRDEEQVLAEMSEEPDAQADTTIPVEDDAQDDTTDDEDEAMEDDGPGIVPENVLPPPRKKDVPSNRRGANNVSKLATLQLGVFTEYTDATRIAQARKWRLLQPCDDKILKQMEKFDGRMDVRYLKLDKGEEKRTDQFGLWHPPAAIKLLMLLLLLRDVAVVSACAELNKVATYTSASSAATTLDLR